ncbi:MAG: beta-propeller fold lactonase family protein [Turneriella sp.]
MQLDKSFFLARDLNPWLKTIIIALLLAACADARGKKPYIDGLEKSRYATTLQQSYQAGNRVNLTDQNGTLRPVALKDIDGDGVADGIDLNGDGNLEIRILKGAEIQLSPWAFVVPVDIDNNGLADYYLYFQVVTNSVQIVMLTQPSTAAVQAVFVVNGSNQIQGIDITGDGVADDIRLAGVVLVTAGSAPDSTPPSQPASPGGASGGSTQIDLSWTAATDNTSAAAAIGYEICQAGSAGGCSPFTATYTVPAGQTNYTATGLLPLTTYYFVIRARDAAGNFGAPSGEFSATTAASGTVNNPTYAPVAGVYGTAQNVTIATTTPAASICYTTDGVTTPVCDGAGLCTTGATYFSAVAVSVTANLQAIACKSGNTPSAIVSGTFTIDTLAPSTPGSFAANPASSTQMDLSWTAATDNVTAQANIVYEICQTATSGACSPFVVSYTTAAGATNYSATGLNALTTYYFVVRAKDSVNNAGTPAGEISATTNSAGTVADPTYTPPSNWYNVSQSVTISTTTPGATICYTDDGIAWPACDANANCTTGVAYSSAINVTTTTPFRALACKQGYTQSSTVGSTIGIDNAAPVPGNSGTLTTSGITTSAITINWTAATDNVTAQTSLEYLLYFSLANNLGSVSAIETNGTAVGSYASNIITQTATGLTTGTTYYFAVIVRDALGNKAAYGVVSGVTNAIAESGFLYTANLLSNDISMHSIDATTGALTAIGSIAAGTNPYFVTVERSGRFAYVVNTGSQDISMYAINASTGSLTSIGTIPTGINPHSITIDPSGRFAYVANYSSDNVSMYTINMTTGILTSNGTIAAGTNPESVITDPSGRFAYVANYFSNNVSMYTINASTGILTNNGTIPSGGTRAGTAFSDPTGKYVYVTNPNGIGVSMYIINPSTGVLTANGTIAAGTSPQKGSIDPTGKFAYIANNSNDVSMYSINASTGTLTSIGTVSAGTTPYSVVTDPTGKYAYVANNNSNNISMYLINAATGVLSANGTIAVGSSPVSLAMVRKPRFAYVANQNSNNVSMYGINSATGALVTNGNIAVGSSPVSVTVDPTGRFAYIANGGSANVSMSTIDSVTGALSLTGTIGAGTGPLSATVDPTGRFAYIANNGSANVSMYTIDSVTGALTANGTIAAGTNPRSVRVDPSGRFVYVANSNSTNVSMYTINISTGTLTANGTILAGTNPQSVTVTPSGLFAYVANSTSANVSMYTINAVTGVLTANGTIPAGTGPQSVTVTPSGGFAYVANQLSADVSMYTINASTGVLSSIGTIAAGPNPRSVTVDSRGRFAYVANWGSNDVSMYTIDAATGALTSNGTIAAGTGPYSVTAW